VRLGYYKHDPKNESFIYHLLRETVADAFATPSPRELGYLRHELEDMQAKADRQRAREIEEKRKEEEARLAHARNLVEEEAQKLRFSRENAASKAENDLGSDEFRRAAEAARLSRANDERQLAEALARVEKLKKEKAEREARAARDITSTPVYRKLAGPNGR
jgi:hypothetical protein